jgi:hypothetical protein
VSYDPIPLSEVNDKELLALFWTDLNLCDNYPLWYGVYSPEYENVNETVVEYMLSRATNDVRYYTDNGDFEASWVLVATWVNAEVVDTDVSYFMVYILYCLMLVMLFKSF